MRRPRARSSRSLAVLLLLVTVGPAAALVWLGARLLGHDRELLEQHDFERRQAAAAAIVRTLDQKLIEAERGFDGPLPDGVVRVTLRADGVVIEPRGSFAWAPRPSRLRQADEAALSAADALDQRDSAAAMAAYQTASRSSNHAVAALALMRIARRQRIDHRWDAAIDAYRRLAALNDVGILDAPADLQARRWICSVLADAGRRDALVRESAALERDLVAGRWLLDRETWQFVVEDFRTLAGRDLPIDPDRALISEIAASAETFHDPWQIFKNALLLRRAGNDQLRLLIYPAAAVAPLWQAAIDAAGWVHGPVSVVSRDGVTLRGPPLAGTTTAIVRSEESGLPWTIALNPGGASGLLAELAGQRRLVYAGLIAPLALLVGGTFFAWRVMRRELQVSRLQTEFMAAVSHEFRTPLTSLRHVADLLDEDDRMSDDERRRFYRTLSRNTDRLGGLVESLLDFSRIESGKRAYEFVPLEAAEFTTRIVHDFCAALDPSRASIRTEFGPGEYRIVGDPQALSMALTNVLDNAVKYSPHHADVTVLLRRDDSGVTIGVRDCGIGVPANEQQTIFDRFVRGREAIRRGIRGTGLGLALTSHIVRAHGGDIALESVEGQGTLVSIVLPAAEAASTTAPAGVNATAATGVETR